MNLSKSKNTRENKNHIKKKKMSRKHEPKLKKVASKNEKYYYG